MATLLMSADYADLKFCNAEQIAAVLNSLASHAIASELRRTMVKRGAVWLSQVHVHGVFHKKGLYISAFA